MNAASLPTPGYRPESAPRSPSREEIDAILDRLDRLAGQPAASETFYADLLTSAVRALGADSCEHWSTTDGSWRCVGRSGVTKPMPGVRSDQIQDICHTGKPAAIEEASDRLLVCPIRNASDVVAALVIDLPLADDRLATREAMGIATALAETAERTEIARQARRVASGSKLAVETAPFMERVHSSNNRRRIEQASAETARRVAGADRATVLVRQPGSWSAVAVSGANRPARKSDAVRKIEALADATHALGARTRIEDARLVHPAASEAPSRVHEEIACYVDSSGSKHIEVLRCGKSNSTVDIAFVVESFRNDLAEGAQQRLHPIVEHSAIALQRVRNRRPRLQAGIGPGMVAIVACVAAMVLLFFPATHTVSLEGRFVPVAANRLFAPMDGLVAEVLVDHADRVEAGQPLIRMRSAELEVQLEKVAESIASSRQEIESLKTARLSGRPRASSEPLDAVAVASRIEALDQQLAHQIRREELLMGESDKLVLHSPIAGEVLSWRPQESLADRPVRRGQRLLEVAETAGAWRIEIDAADQRVAPILNAAESEQLVARYVVKSDPSTEHSGFVSRIASSTHVDEAGKPVVRVEVDPGDCDAVRPRSGLQVVARIECGVHSLGYVWCYDAWQAIQRRWF